MKSNKKSMAEMRPLSIGRGILRYVVVLVCPIFCTCSVVRVARLTSGKKQSREPIGRRWRAMPSSI